MKVLVTGAAGFIGFHTAQRLLERGDSVVGLDNFNDYYDPKLKERRFEILAQHAGLEMIRGAITDPAVLGEAFEALGSGPETRVCHLAAQAGVRHSLRNPDTFVRDNLQGFHLIIEQCHQRGVGGLIYASSSSVYGDNADALLSEKSNTDAQVSLYGMTKKANELQASVYSHLHGLPTTGLRFFTVYGPWGRPDMALFLFTDAILRGEPIKVFGHGKMRRDFTYIDDIVTGVVAAIDRNHQSTVINLGGGKTEELMDFIGCIEKAVGAEAEKEFLPMQPGDVRQTASDLEHAGKMLDYAPTTHIDVGIPRFVDWFRDYYGL